VRILQVSTVDSGAGAAGSARNLFAAYRDRGHESWLAVGRRTTADAEVFEIPNDACRSAWVRFWRGAQQAVTRRAGAALARPAGWLARAGEARRLVSGTLGIEDFDFPGTARLLDLPPQAPDILHLHNLHGGYFDLRYLPALSRRVPTVLNLRDEWVLTGHCAYTGSCERWSTGCGRCPDLARYPSMSRDNTAYNWRRKQRIYARSLLFVTAPSTWLLDRARRSALRAVAWKVIPNGINVRTFRVDDRAAARRTLGLPAEAAIVLLTSHSSFKDLASMEAALSRVRRPEGRDLLFVCMGRTGEPSGLGEGRMIPAGLVIEPGRMADYYRAADVYLHMPTGEAFGKMVVEALACGTPVVATPVAAVPELLDDGVTGVLTPAGEPGAAARAIERLLGDRDLWQRLSASAAGAGAQYGVDRQAEAFLDWYGEVRQEWLGLDKAAMVVS
jgi:glycosyltransferase involved in cell wall biosynthesis